MINTGKKTKNLKGEERETPHKEKGKHRWEGRREDKYPSTPEIQLAFQQFTVSAHFMLLWIKTAESFGCIVIWLNSTFPIGSICQIGYPK